MYDFILDKSEGITVIFADPKLDKSEDVLKNWGLNSLAIILVKYFNY